MDSSGEAEPQRPGRTAEQMVQGAILVLLNGDGRVLLQDRGDDAPAYPGQWGLFGGAVELGETVWQALLREAMEELRHDASNAIVRGGT